MAADIALIVTTPNEADIAGTQEMIRFLYSRIGKEIMILLNKVPSDRLNSEELKKLKDVFASKKTVFCDDMGCYCALPVSEDPCFFACEKEDHPFSKGLRKIVSRLMLLNTRSES